MGTRIYSRGPHGPYSYEYAVRVDPNTVPQQDVRGELTLFSRNWLAANSPAFRERWNTYAKNVQIRGRVDTNVFLTGFNHYVAANVFRGYIGGYPPSSEPRVFTLATHGEPTYARLLFFVFTVTFNLADDWRHQSLGYFASFVSKPQTAEVNHFTGPFLFAGQQVGSPASPPTYANFQFPGIEYWPTPTRRRYFFRSRVSEEDGRLSPSIITMFDYP